MIIRFITQGYKVLFATCLTDNTIKHSIRHLSVYFI